MFTFFSFSLPLDGKHVPPRLVVLHVYFNVFIERESFAAKCIGSCSDSENNYASYIHRYQLVV